MEMLESGHALQAWPALEPDYLIPSHAAGSLATERAGDKVVHLCSRPPSQGAVLRCRAVFFLKRELGPHDQMRDIFVDPVRPVVVKDIVVARLRERGPARRSDVGPPNALVLDEALHRAVCLAQVVCVFLIPAKIARGSLKAVDSICRFTALTLSN